MTHLTHGTNFEPGGKEGNDAEMEMTTDRVPSLSSLCFPTIQTLSLRPIDLSIPLPVTLLGAVSPSREDGDGSIDDTAGSSLGGQFTQPQNPNLSNPSCLKARRLRCRKEIFYKMGLKSHWIDTRKLISAVQSSDSSKVTTLLEQGLDPNVSDQKKRTPLHIAASQGQHEMVRILVSKRADPNQQDILGNTPLHLAVCRGDLKAVKILIENGANIFMRDNSGRTPLSLVRNRLGGLRRSKTSSTDAFKSEFILMSELLCSSAARQSEPDAFVTSIDDLCNQMQTVSTRERADEIADATLRHMGDAVSASTLANIPLL